MARKRFKSIGASVYCSGLFFNSFNQVTSKVVWNFSTSQLGSPICGVIGSCHVVLIHFVPKWWSSFCVDVWHFKLSGRRFDGFWLWNCYSLRLTDSLQNLKLLFTIIACGINQSKTLYQSPIYGSSVPSVRTPKLLWEELRVFLIRLLNASFCFFFENLHAIRCLFDYVLLQQKFLQRLCFFLCSFLSGSIFSVWSVTSSVIIRCSFILSGESVRLWFFLFSFWFLKSLW